MKGLGEMDWAKPNAAALVKFRDGKQGGTLTVAHAATLGSLDAHISFVANTMMVLVNAYEGPMERDWAYLSTVGFDEPRLPRMYGLAKSARWEGSTFILEFQEGVMFHDGTPFDAEAALFNYRRMWDPEFEYYYDTAGAFRGDMGQLVVDMETRGPYTLAITLKERNWDFPDWMSVYGQYNYISPAAIKKYGNEGWLAT